MTKFKIGRPLSYVALQNDMPHTVGRYRRPLTLFVAAAVGWILLGPVRSRVPAGNGLAARYYTNTGFSGLPFLTAYDPVPSARQMIERWGGRPPETFSVVWTGFITVGRADQYRFATISDDGSRLFIDDHLIVDNGGPHGSTMQSGTIPLPRGSHRVRLEYTQFGGAGELVWSWALADGALAPVPAWALSRRAVAAGTVIAARGVDGGRWLSAFLAIAAAFWLIGITLRSGPVRLAASQTAAAYGGASSLAFSFCILAALVLMPWPAGRSAPFFRSVGLTTIELAASVGRVLHDLRSFQSNLSVPLAGEEEGAGPVAQEAAAMLRAKGIDRYQLSPAIAANDWVYEQVIACAWPRKRESGAHVRVVLNTEPATGCEPVSQDKYVSLVYCP
jgi:hypothetical protein